jgi:Sec-independent protein translocase protein TatA
MFETARDLGTAVLDTRRQTDQLSERAGMATNSRDERKAGVAQAETAEPESRDPRDTDHPTGSKQVAENAAHDPPS